jgi:transcriptional regulator with XRE-family HTH domain
VKGVIKVKVERIRALREKRGISQSRAAKDMKIVRTTYSNYEAGNREPDLDTLKKIADYYEVSTDYLLDRDTIEYVDENSVLKKAYDNVIDSATKEDRELLELFVDKFKRNK